MTWKETSYDFNLMLRLKNWCWGWNSNTLANWCEELTHWKRPWCWERLRAGGEGDNRGWDGWMALPTQWTWVWVNSGRWWWTGRPGVLQYMGLQRVRHDWATELNLMLSCMSSLYILDINPFLVISFANIVSHLIGSLFLLMVSFPVKKL